MTVSSVTSVNSLAYQLQAVQPQTAAQSSGVAAADRETPAENRGADPDDRPAVRGATFSTYA